MSKMSGACIKMVKSVFKRCMRLTIQRRKFVIVVAVLSAMLIYSLASYICCDQFSSENLKPCKIHKLNPWDKSLQQYLSIPSPVKCAKSYSLLYMDLQGYLQYNKSAIYHYSLTSLKCVYHAIHRKDGDTEILIEPNGVEFSAPVFVPARLFRVMCHDSMSRNLVYDFVHFNVAYNESQSLENKVKAETDDDFSIIYIGLDSVSRSHALRKLPLSHKYMAETLGAYDFKGFLKVGRNSYPNLVPILTGENSNTFVSANYLNTYVDNLPFIWKSDRVLADYVTHHSEDRPDISTFNSLKGGFNKPPTDYYYRPYGLAMDKIKPFNMEPLGKSDWYCYGHKLHFLLQLDYLKMFVTKYTKRLKFVWFWNNQVGHENFYSLGQADKPLLELLKWLKGNGHLERAVLIVASDHGFRLGGASLTYIGRLENNMPLNMIYIPEILKRKYPWMDANLKYNTEKLITGYDVYQTMKDVIDKHYVNSKSTTVNSWQTKRSLFSKVPEMRNCADAGVPAQYCSCLEASTVNVTAPIVRAVAKFAVQHLNILMKNVSMLCRELSLLNVSEAKVVYTAEGDSDHMHIERKPSLFTRWFSTVNPDYSGRYSLMLYTRPNNGLVEIMVDYAKLAEDQTEHRMKVVGEPVRLDLYGKQSHCVAHSIFEQFCYCKDLPLLS